MQDVTQGVERTRIWPRPRGPAKTADDFDRQDKFRQAQLATKYFAPTLYADAITATEGTPLLPRDIMTMQLFNRLVAFILPDGRILWPMAARNDVSAALDVITADQGDMLIRGPDGWVAFTGPDDAQLQDWLAVIDAPDGYLMAKVAGEWQSIDPASLAFAPRGQCILTRSSAANTTAAGFQRIPMNAVVSDPRGWASLASNGVVPNVAGNYLVTIRARTNTAGPQLAAIGKNGAIYRAVGSDHTAPTFAVGGSCIVPVNGTTDRLEAWVYCSAIRAITTGAFDTYLDVIGPL